MRYDKKASIRLLRELRLAPDYAQQSDALWQLLDLSGGRADNMPPAVACQLQRLLASGKYGCLVEDSDAARLPAVTPLQELGRVMERLLPTVRVSSVTDFDLVVPQLFQRFKERQTRLQWRLVHPSIATTPRRLSRPLLEEAFALQASLGQVRHAPYPVILTLEHPVLCLMQGLYQDHQRGLRHLRVLVVVPRGFLRLVALPSYLLGYEGHDGLVWMQKGFVVRVGGIALSPEAAPLGEFVWRFTDYRWQRRVACHPTTGVVVEHNARVLTR